MKTYVFYRNGDALMPADEQAKALVDSLAQGQGVTVSVRRSRNLAYHRRFFALLRLAFDYWEPGDAFMFRGQKVAKDFERFREEVLILAGHYRPVFRIDGSVRLEAKSISFSSMDETEFRSVYRSVFDVLWNRILSTVARFSSREEVEYVVDQMLGFEP